VFIHGISAIFAAKEKTPKEVRNEIVGSSARILATYREKCSEYSPPDQLILPEVLKLLPVHANCVLKHDALSGGKSTGDLDSSSCMNSIALGSEMTVDDKAWMMSLIPSMKVEDISASLYPRVYRIDGLALDESGSFTSVPIQVRASAEYLFGNSAYLIENALVAFIWIGQEVSSEWLHAVFGVSSSVQLDTENVRNIAL